MKARPSVHGVMIAEARARSMGEVAGVLEGIAGDRAQEAAGRVDLAASSVDRADSKTGAAQVAEVDFAGPSRAADASTSVVMSSASAVRVRLSSRGRLS